MRVFYFFEIYVRIVGAFYLAYAYGSNYAAIYRSARLSLYHNCDSTTIRLRHDYDEKLTYSFFARVESRRMEEVRAIRRSWIVVVSQSYRTHIVISITSVVVECVVLSSYRSRIVVES